MITFAILLVIFLLFLGLPLYLALIAISALLFSQVDSLSLETMVISFQKLQSQDFISAIPLFTYAGYLLARSKSPDRIVTLFNTVFAGFRGANGAIVVILMALFTALTGASGVSILALGGLMLPLLIKSAYSERFSLGLITGSGSIGLLFAPSLPVIIYAIIASQNNMPVNINPLFKAALLPAIILVGSVIVYAIIRSKKVEKSEKLPPKAIWSALKGARYEIPLPFIVYGGIYSGFFTVMEAAIVTAVYVFLMEFVLYRDLKLKKDFVPATIESMKLSGGIFIIMASAFVLTNYFVQEEVPGTIIAAIQPYIKDQLSFLLMVNVFLLITGCLLDIFSAVLIVLPILAPIVSYYGINPYHFAIIFLVNLEIGYLTPPVGMNLFIASYRFKKPVTMLYKASFPFLLIMIGVLLLITYVPVLSTFTLDEKSRAIGSQAVDVQAPAMIKDLQATSIGPESIELSFTASGDDGMKGKVTAYDLRYSEFDIESEDDFEFSDEYFFPEDFSPKAAGKKETIILTDLYPETEYYISIKAIDERDNYSAMSEVLLVETPAE